MGNSLCCHQQDVWNDINEGVIPIDTKKKLTSKTIPRLSPLEGWPPKLLESPDPKKAKTNRPHYERHRDIQNIAFDLSYSFPAKFLSFSQRRFLGFRNRFEFDKKRLILASNRDFVVLGYDYERRPYELLRSFVSYEEEIRFISFIED